MGCFGYLCKGCGTPINGDCFTGGEKCILMHVRHGKVIGQTEGHYNEYGGVVEDPIYRNEDESNPNNHKEICDSEFGLPDSLHDAIMVRRLYKDKEVDWYTYLQTIVKEELEAHGYILDFCSFYDIIKEDTKAQYLSVFQESTLFNGKKDLEYHTRLFYIVYFDLESNYDWREKEENNFLKLPFANKDGVYSGTVAWHSKCYHSATEEQQKDLIPSFRDPNQASGRVRKKYK